jgi:hypothetical protein
VLRSTGVKVNRRWREGPEARFTGNTLLRITGRFRATREKIVSTYCILTGAGAFAIVESSRSRDAARSTGEERHKGWMPDPARSRWIERRAGIGFTMSTQRRASRMVPAMKTDRAGLWRLTAPLMSILWLAWVWLCDRDGQSQSAVADRKATNSLLPDHDNETLATWDGDTGSAPPGRTGVGSGSGLRVSHRSSLKYVPNLLPIRAQLPITLPIAPAGEVRWAERHDGKRDLYFQHAA